jgi:molybdopterin converting factor small subunit
MAIQVLFFGSTAALTGRRSLAIELPEDPTALNAVDRVLTAYPQLTTQRLLFSVNQQYATGPEVIRDGDEIAIFTAVSGG